MKALRRVLSLLLVLCILAAVAALGVSGWMVLRERDRIRTLDDNFPRAVDGVLVLGCGLGPDGKPKPMLHDRMTTAVLLYRSGLADRLLLSGDGISPDYDEPGAMAAFALERGVPLEALILDREGVNTDASLRRARDVYGMERLLIVTQKYHLPRALFLAESYGLEAHGVSATLRSYGPKQAIWSAREVLARDKDFARMMLAKLRESEPPADPALSAPAADLAGGIESWNGSPRLWRGLPLFRRKIFKKIPFSR